MLANSLLASHNLLLAEMGIPSTLCSVMDIQSLMRLLSIYLWAEMEMLSPLFGPAYNHSWLANISATLLVIVIPLPRLMSLFLFNRIMFSLHEMSGENVVSNLYCRARFVISVPWQINI